MTFQSLWRAYIKNWSLLINNTNQTVFDSLKITCSYEVFVQDSD